LNLRTAKSKTYIMRQAMAKGAECPETKGKTAFPANLRAQGAAIVHIGASLVSRLGGSFGKCLNCMRHSLWIAAACWLAFWGARLFWTNRPVDFAIVAPLGLSLVWLLHVAAYAARRTFGPMHSAGGPGADATPPRRVGCYGILRSLLGAALQAIGASFGSRLPDVDESVVIAAYQDALRREEQLHRERDEG